MSPQSPQPLREVFTKRIVADRPLRSITLLGRENRALRKPCTGLAPHRLWNLIGGRMVRDTESNQVLRRDDLE